MFSEHAVRLTHTLFEVNPEAIRNLKMAAKYVDERWAASFIQQINEYCSQVIPADILISDGTIVSASSYRGNRQHRRRSNRAKLGVRQVPRLESHRELDRELDSGHAAKTPGFST